MVILFLVSWQNAFISHLENKLKQENTLANTWMRYVAEIFTILKPDEIQPLLSIMYTPIKFTAEKEDNGKLPFLDVLLIRKNKKIEIEIYV